MLALDARRGCGAATWPALARPLSHLEAETGLSAAVDPRLREYDVGVRSGLTRIEFEERFPEEYAAWRAGAGTPLAPGEETTDSVRTRITAALEECFEALAPGETGVVVAHGAAMKVGILALLGWDWSQARGLRGMDNGAGRSSNATSCTPGPGSPPTTCCPDGADTNPISHPSNT